MDKVLGLWPSDGPPLLDDSCDWLKSLHGPKKDEVHVLV